MTSFILGILILLSGDSDVEIPRGNNFDDIHVDTPESPLL